MASPLARPRPLLESCLDTGKDAKLRDAIRVLADQDPTAVSLAERLLSTGPSAARKATRDGVRQVLKAIAATLGWPEDRGPDWRQSLEMTTATEVRNRLRTDWGVGEAMHRLGSKYHHSRWLITRSQVREADLLVTNGLARAADIEDPEYWTGLAILAICTRTNLRLLRDSPSQQEEYRGLAKAIGGIGAGPRFGRAVAAVTERGIRDAESLAHLLDVQVEAAAPLLSGAL